MKKFFRKYLYSSILIILLFLIINIAILFTIVFIMKNNSKEEIYSISEIGEKIEVDENWNVAVDNSVKSILKESSAWAMILNNKGIVIWEESMPKKLPREYSTADIAKFSKWYLDDYPVFVNTISSGVLVVGYPKNSILKYNYSIDSITFSTILKGGISIITINIAIILILFIFNTRKIEKEIIPILKGINLLSKGKPVSLSEKDKLGEIKMELNRAGKYIAKRDEARKDWISGISHDIRTPLSIILGYAGEIENSESLPLETRKKAEIISNQGDKLRRLIVDLNLTSRLEYSMEPLNIENINLVELGRQIIAEFLNNVLDDKYKIDFNVEKDLGNITIQGDYSLLSRMLNNLIQNSIEHNQKGCHIVVSLNKVGKYYKYSIVDNGIGLSQEQLRKVSAGNISKPNCEENGEAVHGLGLRLVEQIVKVHNGEIVYENIITGGLSVNIFLPI